MTNVLDVQNLDVTFHGRRSWRGERRVVRAVQDVSLHIEPGETLGLVGESGSGKSTIGRAILHLLKPEAGRILFDGADLAEYSGRLPLAIRRDLQAVFQDPFSALDPTKVVAELVGEPLRTHTDLSKADRLQRVTEALERVGLSREHLERYPSEFSGGQRQRICIARAIVTSPKLLVLDEPVSALDVSTQSQVVNLLDDLQRELGVSYLFIAHDLMVVRHVSDRIAVMYRGQIVEDGPAERVSDRPAHPYSQALLASVPVPDPELQTERRRLRQRLAVGELSDGASVGCPFADRCAHAFELCSTESPVPVAIEGGGHVRCHLYDNEATTPQPVAAVLLSESDLAAQRRT